MLDSAAVTLGVGSAPDSLLRFLLETPASSPMGTLPWLLVPTFLVPLYLLTHLAVFGRLAALGHPPSEGSARSGAAAGA